MEVKNTEVKETKFDFKKKLICGIGAACFFVVAIIAGIWILNKSYVNTENNVFEAGTVIKAEDFLKAGKQKHISFSKNSSKIDTSIPGEYVATVKVGMFNYKCKAIVEDTIAPTAEAVTVFFDEGQAVKPEQFVENIQDATKTTVEYVKKPDFDYSGTQEVKVRLTDAGNNSTVIASEMITRVTKSELILEAGDSFPEIAVFLKNEEPTAKFVTDITTIDTKKLGSYEIEIVANDITYTTTLIIKDTKEPVVEVKNVTLFDIDEVKPEDFIVKAEDVTNLTYAFEQEVDLSVLGEKTVVIVVTDEGNNSLRKEAKLTVLHDDEAPVISGVADITSFLGDSIDYLSGVTVKDNHDKDIQIKLDSSNVNINEEGKYVVEYSATDIMGNKSVLQAAVTIIRDTEAPVISGVHDIGCFIGDAIDFLSGISVTDNHDKNLTVQADTSNVNLNEEGVYTVYYSVTDKAGNSSSLSSKVFVYRDTEPPVISGVHNITAVIGENINYTSGIKVTDNHDKDVRVNVDSSAVNNQVCGTYQVTYTATDSAGNTSTQTATVTITVQLSSTRPYEIRVNKLANCVTVYTQDANTGEYTVPYKAFVCSCGGGNTPAGTFKISNKYVWRALVHGVYGQYASRIYGGILFHSVPYTRTSKSALQIEEFNKLGQTASAGCVRLTVEDAKWIYDNCPSGTTVIIYSDENPGPLGKPGAPQITNGIGWDPTDPDPSNPCRQ